MNRHRDGGVRANIYQIIWGGIYCLVDFLFDNERLLCRSTEANHRAIVVDTENYLSVSIVGIGADCFKELSLKSGV